MSDNDYCMIKSMKDGINLYLDPDAPFVELCTSVCRKFAESRDFFGEVAIPIMFSGRVISEEEMKGICECIELNSMVRITLVIDEDLNLVKDRRVLELSDRFFSESILENAKIVKDSVKPGRDVHSDSSILILGDVRENALVEAAGSIIVMGEVKGSCHAGTKGEKEAFVSALCFDSDDIQIAEEKGAFHEVQKKKFFSKEEPLQPKAVFLLDNELLIEPLKNKALSGRR